MTTISESIAYVRSDVCSRRHAARFESAREREPALHPHPSISGLVQVLEAQRKRNYERCEPIVGALIAEYRRDRHPLCTSLLMIVCRPLLVRVRKEVAGDVLASDNTTQNYSGTGTAPNGNAAFSADDIRAPLSINGVPADAQDAGVWRPAK